MVTAKVETTNDIQDESAAAVQSQANDFDWDSFGADAPAAEANETAIGDAQDSTATPRDNSGEVAADAGGAIQIDSPAGEVAATATAPTADIADTAGDSPAATPPTADRAAVFAKRIEDKRHELSDAVLEQSRLKEQAKSAKNRVELLTEELEELQMEAMFDGQDKSNEGPAGSGSVAGSVSASGGAPEAATIGEQSAAVMSAGLWDEPSSSAATPTATTDDNAWRSVPIEQLGLASSLIEKFAEKDIHTIGQLEDLRASRDGLMGVKGIGRAKADKIEESIISWLTANRDRQTLQGNAGPAATGEQAPATIPFPAGQAASASAAANPSAASPPAAADIDPDLGDVTARAAQLKTGEKDCLAPQLQDEGPWQSGQDYFRRGLEMTDCPYVIGAEQDDWLRGWMSAEVLDGYDAEEEAAEGEEEGDTDDE